MPAPAVVELFIEEDAWRTASSRCSRNVRPRKGTRAFGEPMREDSPAESMTAASTRSASRDLHCFLRAHGHVRGARGPSPYADKLSSNADRDFLRRQRADLQPYRRMHVLETLRGNAFALERLIHREHLALAADHADVMGFGAYGPAEYAHVVAVAARDDHQVTRSVGLQFLER